jgi:hypothetical protein
MGTVEGDKPLRTALSDLRAEGYDISDDRFARFKPFGIASERRPRIAARFLTAQTLERLRFILEVERRFGLRRDHDGLALVLAFAGYPVIPWERLRDSADKRIRVLRTRMNVELHRLIGVSGTEFEDRELTRGGRTIANRYMPKASLTSGNRRRANELLAKAFAIVLRGMYRKSPFQESDIRTLLYGLGLPDEAVKAFPLDFLAEQITTLLNSGDTQKLFLLDDENVLQSKLQEVDDDQATAQLAMRRAKIILPVLEKIATLRMTNPDFGLAMRFPDIDSIPARSEDDMDMLLANHVGAFSLAIMLRHDDEALRRIDAFGGGAVQEVDEVIAQFATMKAQIPVILGLNDADA